MTALLYQLDGYLREFDAVVVATNPGANAVALDRTAFYPGGGGQPNDVGELALPDGILPVIKVKREADLVWHYHQGASQPVGTRVVGRIDWPLRYKLMRTHTAMHILCGVIWRDYCAQVTGGNMEPLQGRMDCEFESLHLELVQEIENKVNAEVQCAREVRVAVLPRAEAFLIPDLIRTKINLLPEGIVQVRTVEIVGLDLQADGGTHVANTREVGHMHVVDYRSKGRINKRIQLALES
jgi:misacylated tRNA(Ala) deacylase